MSKLVISQIHQDTKCSLKTLKSFSKYIAQSDPWALKIDSKRCKINSTYWISGTQHSSHHSAISTYFPCGILTLCSVFYSRREHGVEYFVLLWLNNLSCLLHHWVQEKETCFVFFLHRLKNVGYYVTSLKMTQLFCRSHFPLHKHSSSLIA